MITVRSGSFQPIGPQAVRNSLPLTPLAHENILRTCGRLRKTRIGSRCGIAKAANSSRHSAVHPITRSFWRHGAPLRSNSPRATWFAITSASSRIAPRFREIRSFDRPRYIAGRSCGPGRLRIHLKDQPKRPARMVRSLRGMRELSQGRQHQSICPCAQTRDAVAGRRVGEQTTVHSLRQQAGQ